MLSEKNYNKLFLFFKRKIQKSSDRYQTEEKLSNQTIEEIQKCIFEENMKIIESKYDMERWSEAQKSKKSEEELFLIYAQNNIMGMTLYFNHNADSLFEKRKNELEKKRLKSKIFNL